MATLLKEISYSYLTWSMLSKMEHKLILTVKEITFSNTEIFKTVEYENILHSSTRPTLSLQSQLVCYAYRKIFVTRIDIYKKFDSLIAFLLD